MLVLFGSMAKPVKVPKEDRDKYDGHEFRLDIENAVTYEKYEFLQKHVKTWE